MVLSNIRKRSKLLWAIVYCIAILTTISLLSIKTYTSDIQSRGVLDSITEVSIDHNSYIANNTMIINRANMGEAEANQIVQTYTQQGFYATMDISPQYYKITAVKQLPYSTAINSNSLFPLDNVSVNTIDNVVSIEGNININKFNIPTSLLNKYGNKMNIIVKFEPVTTMVDSTGIIYNNQATFNYVPGTTNYVKIDFKEPYIFNVPFAHIQNIPEFLIYISIVGILFFLGYLIIKQSMKTYNNYKERAWDMKDVSYEYPNRQINFNQFDNATYDNFNVNNPFNKTQGFVCSTAKQNDNNPLSSRFYR